MGLINLISAKKNKKEWFITKNEFINYFKYPRQYWFLITEEIENFFESEEKQEELYNLALQDQMVLLREIVEAKDSVFVENTNKLNKLKDQKITDFYKKYFKLPTLSFYSHSSIANDQTDYIVNTLLDPKRETVFFYKPTLISGKLKIKPTALFKYKNKIYLIEHFWSSSLKKESLGTFIFYNHFFTKHLTSLKIDQYLITYLSRKPSPDKELIVEIGNSLPYTSKVRAPTDPLDEKIKNINTLFNLDIEYQDSLYEQIFTKQEFACINNEPWDEEIEDDPITKPEKAIERLIKFKEHENRDICFNTLSDNFLRNQKKIVSPSSAHYKSIVKQIFPEFVQAHNILPFDKTLICLDRYSEDPEKQKFFLEYTSNLKFIPGFPKDQDYIVFEAAIEKYEFLKKKRIKVYYDFESVSLPFPYLENTKPYMQIVLQLSLIKTIDNVEVKPTTNLIIDPLELSINSFKQIIDAIYVDEPNVAYIVYNQSFENTRLKEMAELIQEDEYKQKVISIIDGTVDLANWFTFGNNPHIIHKKLKGFHSIKKVNALIPQDIAIKTEIKNYSDITKCQNGVMAQSLLLSRALVTDPKTDEYNWNKNKEFMYTYCENDVRSMLAVELYIERLIEENKYPLFDPKQFVDKKLQYKRLKLLP
ncbi:DUF2779 domain-containing protein [Candidatus Mycoplasma haematohominis]|uniref:DUF2779 domain-containing protein n=1 Tax=Candidatus Mycoplasma haematohominis TaxID=1494318 RepID=UPI001FE3DE46|nr:DUF2779 domain-containing protein [Candidatus Mycoplasma haemohominis]